MNNIFLLAFSSSIFILRSNIPYAIYIFTIIQTTLLIKSFKNNSLTEMLNKLKLSIRLFFTYILIIVFFIIGFLIDNGSTEVYKDFVNISILISLIVLLTFNINSVKQFDNFKTYFLYCFLIQFLAYLLIALLISTINNDFSNFLFAIKVSKFDRNMYSLNLWISIVSIFVFVKNTKKKTWLFLANILLILLLLLVLLSSSRRGILILGLFSFVFVIFQIYGYIKNTRIYHKFSILFLLYLTILLIVIVSIFVPAKFRNRIINSTNNLNLKKEISTTSYRYYKLAKPEISFNKYQQLLWGNYLTNNYESSIGCKELLKSAKQKYEDKNFTQSINLVLEAYDKTDTVKQFFQLLPNVYKKMLPKNNIEVIKYLPELAKLPYTYTHFFSCINIKNLFLENFASDTINFPFVFSFKRDNAQINLTLPALANSEYELAFKLKAKNNPFTKLLISNVKFSKFQKYIDKNKDTLSYLYHFTIAENKSNSIALSLLLINSVETFAISDIEWRLLNTNNNESAEDIYNKAKKVLKWFKLEQNHSSVRWQSYYSAEKTTNIRGQKSYHKTEIIQYLNNIAQQLKVRKYISTKTLKSAGIDMVIFYTSHPFPRARYILPIVQNAIYKIELDYSHKSNYPLFSYLKRKPETHNVYLKYNILFDTILKLENNRYKKNIIFKVDSINSTTALFVFGFKNSAKNDTLIVNNFKFELLEIECVDVLLSKAQYIFLKDWAEVGKQNNELIEIKKEALQYQNKDFWQIDSSIYKSAGSGRLELWTFGWQYFKSLPWPKKIFGDGFNYYKKYKLKFGAKHGYNKTYSPHNPIISALLYSGIIGALAYLFFLFQVFYYYIKNRKELGIFVLLFLLIFIYSFISGRTHFTIPYFVLFSIFPFLINSIKKQKLKKID